MRPHQMTIGRLMIAVAVVAVFLGMVAWYRRLLPYDKGMTLSSAILAFGVVGAVIALGKALALSISSRTHPYANDLKDPDWR